jgi:hypothetical protein
MSSYCYMCVLYDTFPDTRYVSCSTFCILIATTYQKQWYAFSDDFPVDSLESLLNSLADRVYEYEDTFTGVRV